MVYSGDDHNSTEHAPHTVLVIAILDYYDVKMIMNLVRYLIIRFSMNIISSVCVQYNNYGAYKFTMCTCTTACMHAGCEVVGRVLLD